jgi:predicted HTH domain antitoxin
MKREQMVGSRLPEELLKDLEMIEKLEQTDRSTAVRKLLYRAVGEWKREYYAKQYGEGKISLAKAAEQAGVSLWEMMDYTRQKKIVAQYDLEDFRKDVQTVLRRAGKATAKESVNGCS